MLISRHEPLMFLHSLSKIPIACSIQADNTAAALYMAKAVEAEPGNDEFCLDLERLCRRIPQEHAEALQVGFILPMSLYYNADHHQPSSSVPVYLLGTTLKPNKDCPQYDFLRSPENAIAEGRLSLF